MIVHSCSVVHGDLSESSVYHEMEVARSSAARVSESGDKPIRVGDSHIESELSPSNLNRVCPLIHINVWVRVPSLNHFLITATTCSSRASSSVVLHPITICTETSIEINMSSACYL